jgi:hypothetical protein
MRYQVALLKETARVILLGIHSLTNCHSCSSVVRWDDRNKVILPKEGTEAFVASKASPSRCA